MPIYSLIYYDYERELCHKPSRQLGSGGKEIGEKLAKEFGIAFYDKELIKLASDESGLCKEFFEKADERASQSIIGGLFWYSFSFYQ